MTKERYFECIRLPDARGTANDPKFKFKELENSGDAAYFADDTNLVFIVTKDAPEGQDGPWVIEAAQWWSSDGVFKMTVNFTSSLGAALLMAALAATSNLEDENSGGLKVEVEHLVEKKKPVPNKPLVFNERPFEPMALTDITDAISAVDEFLPFEKIDWETWSGCQSEDPLIGYAETIGCGTHGDPPDVVIIDGNTVRVYQTTKDGECWLRGCLAHVVV